MYKYAHIFAYHQTMNNNNYNKKKKVKLLNKYVGVEVNVYV